MQLNNNFIKLKLPAKVKEIYTKESDTRRKMAGMSLDDQIYSCYRTFITKNFTYSWCSSAELLVKTISNADKTVLNKLTRMKEYNEIKSSYSDILAALDFITEINSICDKYELLAVKYEKISKDALMECYVELCNSSGDTTKIKNFISKMSDISLKATTTTLKYLDSSQLTQYNRLLGLSKNLNVIVSNLSVAKQGVSFKSEVDNVYGAYINIVNSCVAEAKKSTLDYYKLLKKDGNVDSKIADFFTKVDGLTKSKAKVNLNYVDQTTQRHYDELIEKCNLLKSKSGQRVYAFQGIEISYEIDRTYAKLLKQTNAILDEYKKNPIKIFESHTIKLDNLELATISANLKTFSKRITSLNSNYISNQSILEEFKQKFAQLNKINNFIPYYEFIKKYNAKTSLSELVGKFDWLDGDSIVDSLDFPFSEEWKKIKKEFYEYEKRVNKKAHKKAAAAKARRGFVNVITFPFKVIFFPFKMLFKLIALIFIGIGKLFGGLFSLITENHGMKVVFTSIISICLIVLAFVGIIPLFKYSQAYLIITALATIAISIISIVGAFNNSSDLNAPQIILNTIQPLMPMFFMFCGNLFKVNMLMLILGCIGFIVTSIIFTYNAHRCDEQGYYFCVIFNNLVNIIMVIIHSVMKGLCDAKTMYVFFYILMIAMEIYLIFLIFHEGYYYFDGLLPIILYYVGAILMIAAFLCFALAARNKSFLWGAIPGVIISLVVELWGFAEEVDQ